MIKVIALPSYSIFFNSNAPSSDTRYWLVSNYSTYGTSSYPLRKVDICGLLIDEDLSLEQFLCLSKIKHEMN